jgi:hypothetical protein
VPPTAAKQIAMPTEQGVRLDNEEGLLPELGTAGQKDQSNAIAIGEQGAFHLAVEHDELLSKHQVFGDQVGAATGYV